MTVTRDKYQIVESQPTHDVTPNGLNTITMYNEIIKYSVFTQL
ncbi:MAG: hypothetical protein QNJ37_15740 [Crocosphaera sp.]|nr:hypothetical protein [Crocosphaera sp.]